jgi:hypothetical protein
MCRMRGEKETPRATKPKFKMNVHYMLMHDTIVIVLLGLPD